MYEIEKVLATTLAMVMAASFVGCGAKETAPAPSAETVELTMWTMWDGGDVEVAKAMVDEYNAANPNVHIEFVQQDFAQYGTKLKTGVTSGNGPDIAIP